MVGKDIGRLIKKYRLEKGLTQKQLGENCGINEANIRKYELGTQNPKIETLERIAKGLDVPLCKFSLFERMSLSTDSRIADYLDDLNENEKLDICKLLQVYSELNDTGRYKALESVLKLSITKGYRKWDPEPEPDKPRSD